MLNFVNSFFKKLIRYIVLNNVSLEELEHRKSTNFRNRFIKLKNTTIDESFSYIEPFFFKQEGDFELLKIGKNVTLKKWCSLLMYKNSKLIIADNVFFNNYCSINCLEKIEIGENTLFGEGVKVYDHNHNHSFVANTLTIDRNEFSTAPIKIGRNCWIGSNVVILKGVEIGDNVIVGANCLIYKSIPANSTVKHSEVLIIN